MTDNNTDNNETEYCEHNDCDQALIVDELDGNIKVDAGSRKRFCSTEHLLADANRRSLDEKGNVIKKNRPSPSAQEADITVTVPFFDCPYCTNESERIARENSEWLHHTCGEPVPDSAAETANELLEAGEFDRGFVKHEARSIAQTQTPQLKEKDQ